MSLQESPSSQQITELDQTFKLESDLPKQSNRLQTSIAIATLIVAVVSIAISAILVRYSEQEISAYATIFNRLWITALVLVIWNGITTIRSHLYSSPPLSPLSPLLCSQLLLAGICLAADLTLWAWALTQTSVASVSLMSNLTPIFSCLIGWLIWKKSFDAQFLIGMAIAIGGIVALGLQDWHIASFKLHGDLAALLASLSFSIYLIVLERLESQLHLTTILLWSSAIAAGLTFPLVLFSSEPLWPISWQGWLIIITLALICQIFGQGLLVYSLNQLSAEFVAIVLLLEPVLAAVAAWIIFAEKLSVFNCIAFSVILVGIGLASLSQSVLKTVAIPSPANL